MKTLLISFFASVGMLTASTALADGSVVDVVDAALHEMDGQDYSYFLVFEKSNGDVTVRFKKTVSGGGLNNDKTVKTCETHNGGNMHCH